MSVIRKLFRMFILSTAKIVPNAANAWKFVRLKQLSSICPIRNGNYPWVRLLFPAVRKNLMPLQMAQYGFGRYPNVLTNIQLERLLADAGPSGGQLLRPSDGKVAEENCYPAMCRQ